MKDVRHNPAGLLSARCAALCMGLAALLAAAPAPAQLGNPGGTVAGSVQPQSGKPVPGQMNAQDRLFVQLVGGGGLAEVAAARMALQRGSSDRVKAFARRMVEDHQAANQRLTQIAGDAGVPLPTEPDADGAATLKWLSGFQGAAFDSAYLQAQLVDHQKTVQLLQWEMSNGQEPRLQRFAAATLADVIDHLRHVQRALAENTTVGPQGLALVEWTGPASRDFAGSERTPGGAR